MARKALPVRTVPHDTYVVQVWGVHIYGTIRTTASRIAVASLSLRPVANMQNYLTAAEQLTVVAFSWLAEAIITLCE